MRQEGANESDGVGTENGAESVQPDKETKRPVVVDGGHSRSGFEDFARRDFVQNNTNFASQRILTKGMLSKGSTFEIIVSGQIGLKELNMLIRKLELDKEILAEGAEDGPDAD